MKAVERACYSVVVPVFEQWNLVPQLVLRLERQYLEATKYEVIFVDNGSQNFVAPSNLPHNMRVLHCPTPGSYAARNLGASVASGEWLVFTDADCLPEPDWLQQISLVASEPSCVANILVGRVDMVLRSAKPSRFEIYDLVRGIPQERYVSNGYGATANLAVFRQQFEKAGGFDTSRFSGGDAEFCRRIVGRFGGSVIFVESAVVNHPVRGTWLELKTKARRVKGSQIRHGSHIRRFSWFLMTLAPPIRDISVLLRTKRVTLMQRLLASFVRLELWPIEVLELWQMIQGRDAERR